MPGMLFATRKEVWDQQVCELLPIHALYDDFPAAFVEDYAHWLDIDTKVVEWRPLRHTWTSSPDNWQMRADGQEVGLSRGAKRLVDIRSPAAKAISRILGPLEHATHIHVILDCETDALELTGRTGTEEALYGLNTCAINAAASILPRASAGDVAASIFKQAKSFYVFREQPAEPPISNTRDEYDLLERAAIRDSSFQTYGFDAEAYTTDHDATYSSRDQVLNNLTICPRLLSEIKSWAQPILGSGLADNITLGFDPKWVDLPAEKFLPDDWCTLYSILSRSAAEQDKYKIMIFLVTL
ncbi:hypothetical protein BKA61DRAFT_741749 [Leptodontidium sp. MPI-SDFR-AT-0119]|nr:hypothetical protein BKA61DRAFT_741749 [Leptodontidium sp. MPI-SDFR-AT-0119]